MDSATVIKRFDIVEDGQAGGMMTFEATALWKSFIFEGSKEALCEGVIVAVTLCAHALKQIGLYQTPAQLRGGVLAAPIGVEEGTRADQAGGQCLVQGGYDDIGA